MTDYHFQPDPNLSATNILIRLLYYGNDKYARCVPDLLSGKKTKGCRDFG